MESVFRLWANSFKDKSCKPSGVDEKMLFELRRDGDETGLYEVKESYTDKTEHRVYYTTPVYLVWINGVNVLSTTDYRCAVKRYESEVKSV